MYKYQNKSDVSQTITADGDIRPRIVEPGKSVLSSRPIENPNLAFVSEVDAPAPADPKVVAIANKEGITTDAKPIKTETKETE